MLISSLTYWDRKQWFLPSPPTLHCETGGSKLVPAQQRIPVWERNPKATYPTLHFSGQSRSYITPHMTLVFNITFSGHAISSNFYPFSSISNPISAISSHFLPFFFSQLEAFIGLIQPFPITSINCQALTVNPSSIFENTEFLKISVFIWVPSWDSVPILICYQMQAPHWIQSHILNSQCILPLIHRCPPLLL